MVRAIRFDSSLATRSGGEVILDQRIRRMGSQIGKAFDWVAVPNPCGPAACTGIPGGAAYVALKRTKSPKEVGRFLDFLDRKVGEMNELIRGFTQEEHERHGFYLRRQIWPYLMASAFLQRTNLKPRGYAGDAELMIMLYENAYIGTYVFNQLMHKHPVETRAATPSAAKSSARRLRPNNSSSLRRAPARSGHRRRKWRHNTRVCTRAPDPV